MLRSPHLSSPPARRSSSTHLAVAGASFTTLASRTSLAVTSSTTKHQNLTQIPNFNPMASTSSKLKIKKKSNPTTKSSSKKITIDYPIGEITFTNNIHNERYLGCVGKEFVPSPTACAKTLLETDIKERVVLPLEKAKLSLLSRFHEVKQYETPTREFVASFEEYNEDEGKGWKFQLAGKMYKISKSEICEFFDFANDDIREGDHEIKEKDKFWKTLTDMYYFVPLVSPRQIKLGSWKYIHRLVSMVLFTRRDGARFVQTRDLNAMLSIKLGRCVDAYSILIEYLHTWGDPTSANKAIGGGLIVSLLAGYLGINLATTTSRKTRFRPIDMETMVNCGMWCRSDNCWVFIRNVSSRVTKSIENRRARDEAEKEKEALHALDPQARKE